jgi:hypothetical protein
MYDMARTEQPERYSWWLNELESLGVSAKHKEDINDLPEASALTENLKQLFYEEYQRAFNEDNTV